MHPHPSISALLSSLAHPALPGVDLSLDRMRALLAALGDPHLRVPPVIHLAGTNGKGSTLAYLRAVYQAAGYRVHAYSSPHLVRFNERIQLANLDIADDALLPLLTRVRNASAHLPVTFFEATTAAAFLAFAETPADVLLLETGLGGRLDATNVIPHPLATAITPIGFDHMEFLGDTLAKIATEKAGIMKSGSPCILGMQTPEIAGLLVDHCQTIGAAPIAHGRDWGWGVIPAGMSVHCHDTQWTLPPPALLGAHQYQNATLASVIVHTLASALPVTHMQLAHGIAAARWPGRLQRLTHGALVDAWGARGAVLLDGAHNADGARVLAEYLRAQDQPVTLLCGMMARKDAATFFATLAPHLREVVTVPIAGEDCYSPEALAAIAHAQELPARSASSLREGATQLAASPAGILLMAGSLFFAGEILKNHG